MIDGRAQAEAAAAKSEDPQRRIAELEQENAELRAQIAYADNLAAWRNQRDDLFGKGYAQYAPDRVAAIDGPTIAQSTCEKCGHTGMEYRPFFRTTPHSYRAFAVCPACAGFVEF